MTNSRWKSAKSIPDGKKIYVPLNNLTSELMVDGKLVNKDAVDTTYIVNRLCWLNLIDNNAKIYGVRKSEIKNVMLLDDWIDISTIITVALKESVDNVDNVAYTHTHSRDLFIKYPNICNVITDVFNTDELNLLNMLRALTEIDGNRYRNLHEFAKVIRQTSSEHIDNIVKCQAMADEMAKKIYNKYPLLRHVSYTIDDTLIADFVLYVKAKNNQPTI